MRQFVALAFLTGCSLIYNPNNLPVIDAPPPPDTPIADADPSMVAATDLQPMTIYEGQGVGHSRAAVLTIRGSNFVPGATVAIAPAAGEPGVPDLTLGAVVVAGDGNSLAVSVTANLLTSSSEGSIKLLITITEPGGSCTIPWTETTLEKLTAASQLGSGSAVPGPPVGKLYSEVNLTTPLVFTGTAPVVIHSMSTLTIGPITASANGTTPGPGGCMGGTGGTKGMCGGGGGSGSAAALTAAAGTGGGAGFSMIGSDGTTAGNGGPVSGDPLIASFTADAPSGGGGGGKSYLAGSENGGVGGGGGGIVELHADGDLTSDLITANGGSGGSGAGGSGGGGAGGVVVVRAGDQILSTKAITVNGGPGGGMGSPGRVRFDSPSGTIAGAQSGPSFSNGIPLITGDHVVMLGIQIPPGVAFALSQLDQDGTLVYATTPATSGNGTAIESVTLTNGWNHVCLTVPNGAYIDEVANECIDIAFMTTATSARD